MQTQYGFTRFSIEEFEQWVASISVSRVINKIQQHHTWVPNYSHFTDGNHFSMQKGMKDYHVNHHGWADIGQHFSIFPDGEVVTGRPLNQVPACILGNNSGSICIENVGDFDADQDDMTDAQKASILRATAALARKFSLNPVTTNNIVYHHWYDLNTGERKNGGGVTKTCPGTGFFGGNRVQDSQQNFLRLVQQILDGAGSSHMAAVPSHGVVTTDSLNIRTGAGSKFSVVQGQGPLDAGAIVRVFRKHDGWLKIANSQEYWVYSKWIKSVSRRVVNTDDTNGRAGPGTIFPSLKTFMRGDEVFVHTTTDGWSSISLASLWVRSSLID
jgi:uncharacterized protein YgiM (DUF1202 family)